MGVPKFFRYMSERYPCLSELVKDYQIPEFDNLYLDMNGIIHNCSHPNDDDPHFRITEETIVKNIFHYLEVLFQMIQPQKLFFMAIDGVAPRAKMNQQRGRRFRSAHTAAEQTKEAISRGETLPSEERFDSNCITPGTPFMVRLQSELEYFVADKMSNDPLWTKVQVILSGHQVPGEGEHKIMDYIRYMKSRPGYNPHTRHCLYGLDADLIMLGLCTHEPYFSLLREEVKFGRKTKKETSVDETQFYLLHLSLMRDYLGLEFQELKETLPFEYDLESIIDDWVLMGFLVGNDFIPHLPDLHISKGALPILYRVYMDVLPKVEGYLNEQGTLNLKRFQKFMETLANFDYDQFRDTFADIKFLEGKRTANTTTSNKVNNDPAYKDELAALIKDTDRILLSDDDDEEEFEETEDESIMAEFNLHKENYYKNKLDYNVITDDVMRSQAEGYIRALQWNLNYYYNGCCSWAWYYPHHYAPYISDIKGFENLKIDFDLGQPFLPYEQLLAVLPSLSKELLPKPFQDLMTEEASPIRLYYPEKFETDLNGKQHEWEAVVLIPFIDEETLIKSMKMVEHKLTADEKNRNTHGPMHLFKYSKKNLGTGSISKYFPSIEDNHAEKIAIHREDIFVDISDLVKGLCPGLQMDVYHVGFPSLHLIPITAQLQRRNVKVFQSPSLGENMIIKIDNKDENDIESIQHIAKELLGNTLYVNWPHLEEIKVTAVSNTTVKLSFNEDEQLIIREMSETDVQEFNLLAQGIAKMFITTRGIEIGKTHVLLRGHTLKGTKFVPRQDGSGVDLTKVWNEIPTTIAYQTSVPGLEVIDPSLKESYFSLEEYFPIGSKVFVLDAPFYGCQADVLGGFISSRVKINILLEPEPYIYDLKERLESVSTELFYANTAASKLSINSHLLAKITGTIFLAIETYEDRNEKKMNIGMNLKSNKRNEEVVGYTKKFDNVWMYSQKTIDLLGEYIQRFPELINVLLSTENTKDTFSSEDMFPNPSTRKQKLDDLKKWLSEIRSLTKDKQTCGSMEPSKVAAIEKYMDEFIAENLKHKKTVTLSVKSQNLFKPISKLDKLKADEGADTRVLDRVVCIRSSYQVPLGFKGTVVSISKSNIDTEVVYSVIFDKEFPNSVSFGGSTSRGYKLCRMSFINLSHAIRNGLYKPLAVKKTVNQTPNSEKQNTQLSIWEHLQKKEFQSQNNVSKILQTPTETPNDRHHINNNSIKIQLNAEACEFKTIALKKMLKIQPEDNFVPTQNENEPEYFSNKPVNYLPETSLHELKTVELQCPNYNTNEQVNENVIPKLNSLMESIVQEKSTMVVALEKYYIQKGYSLPKYSFINLVDDSGFKMYCAEVILPNGVTMRGEPKHSYIEASEEVASRALVIVQQMDANKNNEHSIQNKPPKSDRRAVPPQQAPSNVFMNWITSFQSQPSYQSQQLHHQQQQQQQQLPQQQQPKPPPPQQQQHQHQQQQPLLQQQPQQQQPYSQVPQYFEHSTQHFRTPFQQYPPGFSVPAQQSFQIPYPQQIYRQQNHIGFPLQQQQFLNYQQELQYSKAVPVFTSLVNPSQLPQPPVHWQPTNRNLLNNDYVMNSIPNTYHQPQQNMNYQQYMPTTPNDTPMNEQYMSSNRVMIPSPSSAFSSAANDQSTSNRKVKVAANFNSSQH
ncbi:5'-3' exoribonuclease 1 isoform X2 [Acyrthosiphon pisum]|uniref:5'-3' exoribonuclease 2 n=1 Tax=Acyrthosiphon pisum TaxID=7029 RepID=A0A8R2NRX2_ACYPI|nr:5'-3' exoribonuclease 1 isoform X2 [Acyrthosiphon pisum]